MRSAFAIGGGKEIRTPDIQLAKLALYQLSYAPSLEISGFFRRHRESAKNCDHCKIKNRSTDANNMNL
jgi:hypothetical protein